jgi:hypothetical protein
MPPDWLSWEFWAATVRAIWAGYVANRENVVSLATLIAGAIGIPLLYIRTRAADRQARTAEQGHITDRFTAAVEQLGSDKMAVRLGAIYALERISRDSRRDHWTIMETLTAYVREHAPWPPRVFANPFVELQGRIVEESAAERPANEAKPAASVNVRPATDIQAVLTVLGRREARKRDEAENRRLDLTETDLRGANLSAIHMENADFTEAHLEGADLDGAHLEGADLDGAHLEGANLWGAHLEGARLRQEQLDRTLGGEITVLPAGLTPPAHWPAFPPAKLDNAR